MALNVKNKIRAGTLFLFLMLLIVGGTGIFYIIQLKTDSNAILKANDQSIEYCQAMQKAVDSLVLDPAMARGRFAAALQEQEQNVTENGEAAATGRVRSAFGRVEKGDLSPETLRQLDAGLQEIMRLNLTAIQVKNRKAQQTAEKALTIITVISGGVFLVAFTFAYNFPSILVDPIRQFTNATEELGRKNYGHRIRIGNKDEFGELAASFNSMAERLDYFEHSNLNKILFEKNRAESVINTLKDASFGLDSHDLVLFANNQALTLLGLKTSDVVGKPATELAKRNDLFRHLLEAGNQSSPVKVILDNKENFFTRESMEVGEGENRSKVIILKNITPFREIDAAKTHFIATISHELKTPIASVKMGVQLLDSPATGDLNPDQRQLINGIREDSDRLLRIVAELLNMAQVETGNLHLNLQAGDPEDIISYATESVKTSQEARKLTILIEKPAVLPQIQADSNKTAWVLINLLTNAIRYSPEGSVIRLMLKNQHNFIEFSVQDEGNGIDPKYKERIFDRYFQVPGSANGGTGLGLAISRDFIDAQAGKIGVESEPGKGSRFWFALPVA